MDFKNIRLGTLNDEFEYSVIKNKVTPAPFLEMTGVKRGCYMSGFLFLLTSESCNIQSKKRVRGLA